MLWTKEKVQKVKGLRLAGWSYEDIAKTFAPEVSPRSISYIVSSRRIIPKQITKKFAVKNMIAGQLRKQDNRWREFLRSHRHTLEGGWLVGLLAISGKCNNDSVVYFSTPDETLAKEFVRIASRLSENKIRLVRQKFFYRWTYMAAYLKDVRLAKFLIYLGGRFLRRRGRRVHRQERDYYRGILQGVFDARGAVRASGGRSLAVRLYLQKLPAGAVHNIRIALARFGIKYSMQGMLSRGERRFFSKATANLNKLVIEGASQFLTDKLAKRIFPKDYEKRQKRFFHTAALKIKNSRANLSRFSRIINFRRSDLKSELAKLVSNVNMRSGKKEAR